MLKGMPEEKPAYRSTGGAGSFKKPVAKAVVIIFSRSKYDLT
jgi:hypothetical protein